MPRALLDTLGKRQLDALIVTAVGRRNRRDSEAVQRHAQRRHQGDDARRYNRHVPGAGAACLWAALDNRETGTGQLLSARGRQPVLPPQR